MKPYVVEVCCEVCGQPGMATPRTAVAAWTVGVVHSNPAVCRDYLERKARRLEEKEKALAES